MIKICLTLALLSCAMVHAGPSAWFDDSCVLAKFVETGKAFNDKNMTKNYPMELGSCLDTLESKIVLTDTKTSSALRRAYMLDSANRLEEELKFSRSNIDVKHNYASMCTYFASIVKTPSDSFNIDSLKAILSRVQKLEETSLWRTKNNVYFQLSLARPTCEIQASGRTSRRLGRQTGYMISCTFHDSAFSENLNPCILNGLEQEEMTIKRGAQKKSRKSKSH